MCFDRPDPLNPHNLAMVSCPMVIEKEPYQNSKRGTNMFNITFSCGSSDKTLCSKAQQAFKTAGQYISDTIAFNQMVNVNATFTNLCAIMGGCIVESSGVEAKVVGGAAPSRSMLIQDNDGIYRFYPQALVKQRGNTNRPEYSDFDITAMFNSENISYWFQGDGNIRPDQTDLEMVILHELIHGLGFMSSLDDYINNTPTGLTPYIIPSGNNYHFYEDIFDKYMSVQSSGQTITSITKQMDVFGNTTYPTPDSFVSAFESSSQYNLAKNLYSEATKPNSFALLSGSNKIVLETSLTPYNSKSSVSHFSYETYSNTSDFLMRYMMERGITLQQYVQMGGNYKNGPIGPKLRSLLQNIG
ncbi:3197_t:CDS:2, partial [Scutellospora calospora]